MIRLTTEQAQQIEEALEDIVRVFKFETGTPVEALATIRAARAQADHIADADKMVAEQLERRPQNCGTTYCSCIECPYKECVQDKKQCINGCLTNKTTKALKLAEEAFEALVHTPIAGHIWTGKCNPALFAIRAARAQEHSHPDDEAVDRFAAAMKTKLAKKRSEGRGGWEDKNQCSAEFLNRLLNEHVGKGDPVDVGNLAMMLWNRGERTEAIAQEQSEQEPVASSIRGFSLWLDREAWGHVIDGLMLERERSAQRKAANPDSNSNYIANRCAELIAQIGQVAAAPVEPVKQEPVACVRSLTEQCAALVWERDELQKKLRQYEKHGVTCQTYQHKVERSCSECNENENYANSVQQAEQEPVGKIVAFGGSLHEVSWRRGKMPPLGTDLYAAPVEHRRKNRE